jgi:hypothetical protein
MAEGAITLVQENIIDKNRNGAQGFFLTNVDVTTGLVSDRVSYDNNY